MSRSRPIFRGISVRYSSRHFACSCSRLRVVRPAISTDRSSALGFLDFMVMPVLSLRAVTPLLLARQASSHEEPRNFDRIGRRSPNLADQYLFNSALGAVPMATVGHSFTGKYELKASIRLASPAQ